VARLGYLGTPEFAVAPLEGLLAAGHEVGLVVSRPDRRRGRGATQSPSPVKAAALAHGLEVTDEIGALAEAGLDGCVVVAYGRIIPSELLDSLVMLNLHFSLLPRWRGAAPLERAILAGDLETGVCVMGVAPELDTGPIYAEERVEVGDKTLSVLRSELVERGTELLVELLAEGFEGLPRPVDQVGQVTYAQKLDPSELELDLSRPASEVLRTVRLERAYTWLGGKRLRILAARLAEAEPGPPGTLWGITVATGEGALALETVQPENKRPMGALEWRRGLHEPGEVHLGRESDL
jgi:methionyl-tRNA formyltransferase